MQKFVLFSVSLVFLALAGLLGCLTWCVSQVPHQIDAFREEVSGQLTAARQEVLAEVDHQATDTRRELIAASTKQIDRFRVETLRRVDRSLDIADSRLGDSFLRMDIALGKIDTAISAGQPVLTNTALLEAEMLNSWTGLSSDVKAMVESATTATRGVTKASDAAGHAAESVALLVDRTSDQVAGITTDVHAFTSEFIAPRPWYARVWKAIKSGVRTAGRLLP